MPPNQKNILQGGVIVRGVPLNEKENRDARKPDEGGGNAKLPLMESRKKVESRQESKIRT